MRTLGYDNSAINQNLLLDLSMEEGVGTITRDIAKPHHNNPTLTGTPTWSNVSGLGILDFNSAHPDFVQIASADTADLNFTSGAFSVMLWVYPDANNCMLVVRGLSTTDGWYLYTGMNGALNIQTSSPAAVISDTPAGEVVLSIWQLIGITRSGTSIRLYKNGVDKTLTAGSHTNPASANRKLHIGIYDDEALGPFDGKMYRPRIWSRALAPREINELFQRERGLFGV